MDKAMGILLMVVFGVGGAGIAALAWLVPSLNLDKFTASLGGLIGLGFAVFQSFHFKYAGHVTGKPVSVEVKTAEYN